MTCNAFTLDGPASSAIQRIFNTSGVTRVVVLPSKSKEGDTLCIVELRYGKRGATEHRISAFAWSVESAASKCLMELREFRVILDKATRKATRPYSKHPEKKLKRWGKGLKP